MVALVLKAGENEMGAVVFGDQTDWTTGSIDGASFVLYNEGDTPDDCVTWHPSIVSCRPRERPTLKLAGGPLTHTIATVVSYPEGIDAGCDPTEATPPPPRTRCKIPLAL